jgi:hypothetical protein
VEEVAGEHARSLCPKGLRRRRPRCAWCRPETVTAEDIAHTGPRHCDPELAALPRYAEVTPARVLPCQAKYEGDDLVVQSVRCGPVMSWVGPGTSDELAVPAQQRRRVTRNTAQRSRLSSRARVASNALSAGEQRGPATWRRSTANWWRSTAISTSFSPGVGPSPNRSSRRRMSRKVI